MFSAIRTGVMAKKGLPNPSVVGSQTFSSSSAATSHAITMPSGIQAGELLVCFASIYSYNAQPTATAGWDNSQWGYVSSTIGSLICYKIANGSDTLTIGTGSTSRQMTAITYRIANANTLRVNSIGDTASGTTALCASVYTCVANSLTFAFMGLQTAKTCSAGSSGYSSIQRATAGTNQCETAACYKEGGSSGTRTPGAFTVTSAAKYLSFVAEIKQV
jgi:hypothetical protein